MTYLVGDALTTLKTLTDNSVQCCITSPPYWGLRSYDRCSNPNCGACYFFGLDDKGNEIWKVKSVEDHQLGLEKTPEEYVANMVAVFREVKRVLRPDGTCWVNLGDSYSSDQKGSGGKSDKQDSNKGSRYGGAKFTSGLKPKDLVGIPWRVAFALQADGWWLRSDIIWSKPNPMPESVTDRPTRSHEYIFLLTKSARYFYDAEAVREAVKPTSGVNMRAPKCCDDRPSNPNANVTTKNYDVVKGANRRSVWEIPTQPVKESHFATFPEKLVEICLLAGTSHKACAVCGAPWERVVEKKKVPRDELPEDDPRYRPNRYAKNKYANELREGFECGMYSESTTTGFRPTCDHDNGEAKCLVLDPFAGSGTVLRVAERLGRDSIGIDLQPNYEKIHARKKPTIGLSL